MIGSLWSEGVKTAKAGDQQQTQRSAVFWYKITHARIPRLLLLNQSGS
jgi:hypothetical protein